MMNDPAVIEVFAAVARADAARWPAMSTTEGLAIMRDDKLQRAQRVIGAALRQHIERAWLAEVALRLGYDGDDAIFAAAIFDDGAEKCRGIGETPGVMRPPWHGLRDAGFKAYDLASFGMRRRPRRIPLARWKRRNCRRWPTGTAHFASWTRAKRSARRIACCFQGAAGRNAVNIAPKRQTRTRAGTAHDNRARPPIRLNFGAHRAKGATATQGVKCVALAAIIATDNPPPPRLQPSRGAYGSMPTLGVAYVAQRNMIPCPPLTYWAGDAVLGLTAARLEYAQIQARCPCVIAQRGLTLFRGRCRQATSRHDKPQPASTRPPWRAPRALVSIGSRPRVGQPSQPELRCTMATSTPTPAAQLNGVILSGGETAWRVIDKVKRSPHATGGHFSVSYIVESQHGGIRAFLKAMDYHKALGAQDPALALQSMTAAYNFERDILIKCQVRRLNRIVRVLDSGTYRPPSQATQPADVVQYLIFEMAQGDIRAFAGTEKIFDMAWALRTAHHVASALQQLHNAEIAHQDVKPSNILVFAEQPAKLADLGRASDRNQSSSNDTLRVAGDKTYAPPEFLYGHVPQEWGERRLGYDVYTLGSILVFLCTGVSMTHHLLTKIDHRHHYTVWRGSYDDVLQYIKHAFSQILRQLNDELPSQFSSSIVHLVRHMCNPDPRRRGLPKNLSRNGNRYSLERYISMLDLVAKKAELSLRRNRRLPGGSP